MSSTANPPLSKTAPWRSAFLESLSTMDSPEFVLATLVAAPAKSNSPTGYLPRARYCMYRGMWAELPSNSRNTADKNERIYESDLPTFTTDVRMEKVGQLFGTSAGKARGDDQVWGSGGGGPVEAVWWMKDEGTQWRIRGHAFVVGPDIEAADSESSSGVRTIKSEVGERMRLVAGMEGRESEWSWARELTAHFGNLSPGMRGTFKSPPPGQPVHEPYDADLELGTTVDDLHHETARKNFRVCIIKPDEVEKLLLREPCNAQRWKWTFSKDASAWIEVQTWP